MCYLFSVLPKQETKIQKKIESKPKINMTQQHSSNKTQGFIKNINPKNVDTSSQCSSTRSVKSFATVSISKYFIDFRI